MLVDIAIKVTAPDLNAHLDNENRVFSRKNNNGVSFEFFPDFDIFKKYHFATCLCNNLSDDSLRTVEFYARAYDSHGFFSTLSTPLNEWLRKFKGSVELVFAHSAIIPNSAAAPCIQVAGMRTGFKNQTFKPTLRNIPHAFEEYNFYAKIQHQQYWVWIFEQVTPAIQPKKQAQKIAEQARLF